MASKIKRAKVYRQAAISEIQFLNNFAKQAESDINKYKIFKSRYSDIERIRDEFDRQHTIIVDSVLQEEESDLSVEDIIKEGFLADYYDIKAIYESLTPGGFTESGNLNSSISISKSANVRLPKLELKRFTGDCTQFPTFIGLFNSLVHNNTSLSNDEKINYLVSTLDGPPLKLIQHYEFCGKNYQSAYDTLFHRYNNKRWLAKCHWRRIEGTVKVKSKVPNALRNLLDTFQENISALRNLQFPTDEWDFILLMMLYDRIDDETISRFEHSYGSSDVPKYRDLTTFLERECVASEMLNANQPSTSGVDVFRKKSSVKSNMKNFFVENTKDSLNASPSKCVVCKNDHPIFRCKSFLDMKPFERYNLAKRLRLCFNCLSNLHDIRSCKSKSTCRQCSLRHHTFLHFKIRVDDESSSSNTPNNNNSETQSVVNFAGAGVLNMEKSSYVLLGTAAVEVSDSNGSFHKLRCLIDSGSMTSFITKKAVSRLNLRSENIFLEVTGLNSSKSCISKGQVSITLKPAGQTSPILYTNASIINQITDKLPTTPVPICIGDEFKNLKLADPTFHVPGHIDILLGADMFSKVLLGGHVTGNNGINAFNSVFGYVLIGGGSGPSRNSTTSLFCDINCQNSDSNSLPEIVKRFWEVESVPSTVIDSPADKLCEKIFVDTHKRHLFDGKYIVSLPFANDMPSFSGMEELASKRFLSLERRLLKNPALYKEYSDFMREYLDCEHMEIAPENSSHVNPYYLVHHCVLKPSSTHTKLRVVFNASARAPSGFSLNDNLLTGPKLQTDIVSILLKFRIHPYVLCADVKQMYRMIWLNPDHRDYQRIFWRFSLNEPLTTYRLKTVTYGVSSAPFLALRCLKQLAQDEGNNFPLAAKVLLEDTYIDDVVTGASSLEEAKSLQCQLIGLFEKGGFNLRKWSSNSEILLEAIPASMRTIDNLDFSSEADLSLKILGLLWNPISDTFSFSVLPQNDTICTKRQVLSQLARIYDPLGFLAPVTLLIKYLIQRFWMMGLTWDDQPPDEILRIWNRIVSQIQSLSQLEMKRHLTCSNASRVELHGFCDSSEKGYCAVLYLKTVHVEGNSFVNFVIAKSKVAPLKKICIPRLELCAAVLLAKLMSFVLTVYSDKLSFTTVQAWSDSQVVLAWLRSPSYRWKNFVANRVSYIQEKIPFAQWNYVRSEDNPADLGSRGLFPSDLLGNKFWLIGPKFLYDDQTHYVFPFDDSSNNFVSDDLICEERKINLLATSQIQHFCESLLKKYSNFSTVLRVCAYVMRFVHNMAHIQEKRYGPLGSLELHLALITLAKYTQLVSFTNEISSNKFSKPLRRLNVFKGEDDLLRVGGRLSHSDLRYETKHPILLPRKSLLTDHLIDHYHRKYFHVGPRQLQFLLAQRFWILSPRRAINGVLSKCVKCFRMKPIACQPPMGNLPESRFSMIKAFLHSGCDYAGPFTIAPMRKYRGQKTSKAYICIFVCHSTKAVHLELANNLSSESFLAALQRFISRRGRCTDLYCDNGTNFIGANRELLKLMKISAEKETIKFHFNPPSGSHFGGLFEAAVKSVKTHLLRVVGAQVLTYEEFYTILTLIESLLNSRPLCALSSDPDDLNCLTPGHFLTLEPLTAIPVPDMTNQPLNRLSRWQLLQNIHQHFWRRWRNEYLHTLQQRVKWLDISDPVTIGKLVLIKTENIPPNRWRLGRIITLFKGSDGISRVAQVKTSDGILIRPLVKLCPLPHVSDSE